MDRRTIVHFWRERALLLITRSVGEQQNDSVTTGTLLTIQCIQVQMTLC